MGLRFLPGSLFNCLSPKIGWDEKQLGQYFAAAILRMPVPRMHRTRASCVRLPVLLTSVA